MKRLIFPILILLSQTVSAQIRISNNCLADLTIIEKEVLSNRFVVSDELRLKFPINTINHVDYLSLLAKVSPDFNEGLLEEQGIMVGSRISSIVSLKFPISQLENVLTMPGVIELQVAGKIKPDLNKVLFDTKVDSVHAGYGLPSSYTGKDVLIGITDWGFDYSHPMFYDTLLENTRILAAWDQFKTSGPAPVDYGYGTEYSTASALIAAGADTANIYSFATHGSHVAGIAGGSGAGLPYRGVAFEAQFLFTTFLVDEGAVLDAWEWMYNKATAEGKRLVVNMSWGLYNVGALDGTSILSQAIDNYSDLGVVFVNSGGNNGDVDFHIKKEFSGDLLLSRITFYDAALASLWGQSIHAWGEEEASFSAGIRVLNGANVLQVESPLYNTLVTSEYIDSFLVVPATTDTIFYNLSMDDAYPTNGRPQMRLRVKKGLPGYKIVLKSTADEGTVHFWNLTELVTDVGNWGMEFQSLGAGYTAGDNQYGIGSPACTNSSIAVAAFSASYQTESGTIIGGGPAAFSSYGPMMNDELKPDLAAPGVSVCSSISSYTDNSFGEVTSVSFEGRDYPFARFSGTSMSSPAVAGIVALMLEANPYLSPWQVKILLKETAREDSYTGEIPETGSTKWGFGKVNAYFAVVRALQTTGVLDLEKPILWKIYPNPTSEILYLKDLPVDDFMVQLVDLNGRLITELKNPTEINVENLAPGTYLIRLIHDNKVEQQKFIVQ